MRRVGGAPCSHRLRGGVDSRVVCLRPLPLVGGNLPLVLARLAAPCDAQSDRPVRLRAQHTALFTACSCLHTRCKATQHTAVVRTAQGWHRRFGSAHRGDCVHWKRRRTCEAVRAAPVRVEVAGRFVCLAVPVHPDMQPSELRAAPWQQVQSPSQCVPTLVCDAFWH
jgi:hypothetical protein